MKSRHCEELQGTLQPVTNGRQIDLLSLADPGDQLLPNGLGHFGLNPVHMIPGQWIRRALEEYCAQDTSGAGHLETEDLAAM